MASPSGQIHAARRFLTRTQKHTKNHMRRLATFKARQAISGKIPEAQKFEP